MAQDLGSSLSGAASSAGAESGAPALTSPPASAPASPGQSRPASVEDDLDFDDPTYSEPDNEPDGEGSEPADTQPQAAGVAESEWEGEEGAVGEPSGDQSGQRQGAIPATFTSELLELAQFYGFSPEEAKSFGTPDNLVRSLVAIDRRLMAAAPQFQQPDTAGQQPAANTPAGAGSPEQGGSSPFEKFKIELDPNEFDEQTISLLNGINDHYDGIMRKQHEALESLRSEFASIAAHLQREEGRRYAAEMDSFFDGLGEEYADLFGKGPIERLDPTSPHFTNRRKVAEEMNALYLADQQMGRTPSTGDQLRWRAIRALFGDQVQSLARKQITKQIGARRQQSVARPTGRHHAQLAPEQAAARFAKDFYKRKGAMEDEPAEI